MFFTDLIKVRVLTCCESLLGYNQNLPKKFAIYAISAVLFCGLNSPTQVQIRNTDLRDERFVNFKNFERTISLNMDKFGFFDKGYNMLENMMDFIDWCIKNDLLEKDRLKGH